MKPRHLQFERLESRTVLSTLVGQAATESATPQAGPVVAFHLEVTDAAGAVQSSFQTGEGLVLNVLVEDLRPDAQGVFTAMLDVFLSSDMVVPAGAIEFGEQFPNVHLMSCGADGVFDEIGAMGSLTTPGPGPLLVMRIPFLAVAPGSLVFFADPADKLPDHEVLVYGWDEAIPSDQVAYDSVQIEISGSPFSDAVVPCHGDIGKVPMIPEPKLEELAPPERRMYPRTPAPRPVPEIRVIRAIDHSQIDYPWYPSLLGLPNWDSIVELEDLRLNSHVPGFVKGFVDLPSFAVEVPLVPDGTNEAICDGDTAPFSDSVQLNAGLPIMSTPVVSHSTAESATRDNDPESDELLVDGADLSLQWDDLNASK